MMRDAAPDASLASALYAAAWFAAPSTARAAYGRTAREHFADEYARLRADASRAKAVAYAVGAVVDAIANGIAERLATIARDVGYAARSARRTPLFSLLVVVMLAVALGANIAIDSVLGRLFLTQLPFADPATLVTVWESNPAQGIMQFPLSYADAAAVRAHAAALDAAILESGVATIRGAGAPVFLHGESVSGEYFRILGTSPRLGRAIDPDDERHGRRVMVISDHLWRTAFGSDPHAVGRVVDVDRDAYTVIGVMPRQAYALDVYEGNLAEYEYVIPLRADLRTTDHNYSMIARRTHGASLTAIDADLTRIVAARQRAGRPVRGTIGISAHGVAEVVLGGLIPKAAALAAAVTIVLVIACVNVANLFLARGSTRVGEFTIRYALGAARRAIVMQLLTESAVYAVVAGAIGFAGAAAALPLLAFLVPDGYDYAGALTIDARMAGIAVVTIVATVILAGVVPSLVVSRRDLSGALKRAGRGGSLGAGDRLRAILVACEIAMAIAVVVDVGLAVRTLQTRLHEPMGFVAHDRSVVVLDGGTAGAYAETAASLQLLLAVRDALAAIPGVADVAASEAVPNVNDDLTSVTVVGRRYEPGHEPFIESNDVTPGLFRVMGTAVLAGRDFTSGDRVGTPPVALVNETFARTSFGGVRAALGKRIAMRIGGSSVPSTRTIVGVVANMRANVDGDFRGCVYVDVVQTPEALGSDTFLVRSPLAQAPLANAIRSAIARVDPRLPLPHVRSLEDIIAGTMADTVAVDTLVAILGAIALVLALGGVVGVIVFSVARRTHEIGIRLALGATPRAVTFLVFRTTLVPIVVGVLLGTPLAALGARALDGTLIESGLLGPPEEIALVALVVASVVLAAYLPARRAARVEPLVALRYE